MLTVPSVVSFTTGAGVEDPEELLVTGGEVCSSLFTMLAAAFCSTTVGGDWSGREMICFIVSLDGEKDAMCASQPDFTCSAKCLTFMTAVQEDLYQHIKRAPINFRTTSEAGTNRVGESS